MAYSKNLWDNGDIITKSKMNNIENGISDAHVEIEKIKNNTSSGTGITDEQATQLTTAYQHSQAAHAPSNAEANVQSDWNITDSTNDGFIKNKPTIPSIEGLATETFVTNKIAEASLSGGQVDLSGYVTKETGNANQITFADGQTFQVKLDNGTLKGDKGDQGAQGEQGLKGDKGDKGDPGIQGEIGPQGIQGPKGDKGDTGERGPAGANGQDGLTTQVKVNGTTYVHTDGLITLPDYPTVPTKTSQLTNDSSFATETYVSNKIAEATLSGGQVDLSGYVTKETGNANQITFADGQTFQAKLNDGSLKGDKGDQGPQGIQGPQGERGLQGEQGPQGLQGEQGPAGYTPVKGVDYFDGAKGDKGDKGDTGAQGPQGEIGPQGPKGDTGIQGPQGLQGEKGDTGAQGPAGADGLTTAISVNGTTYTHVSGTITLPNYPTVDVTKAYVDGLVGNIDTVLDSINGEVI